MSDDKTQRTPADASRISLEEDYEVAYWTDALDVGKDQLREAVDAVWKQRGRRQGLPRPRLMGQAHQPWSTTDEAYLRECFDTVPIARIARDLERSIAATRTRARHLELARRPRSGGKEPGPAPGVSPPDR